MCKFTITENAEVHGKAGMCTTKGMQGRRVQYKPLGMSANSDVAEIIAPFGKTGPGDQYVSIPLESVEQLQPLQYTTSYQR